MIITLIIILAFVATVYLFMQQNKFGKIATGERLEQIKKSPNFKNGKFQNINFTPDLTEGVSYYKVIKEFFFDKSKRVTPVDELPSQKTNLLSLDVNKNVFVWFGHSSYFMQIDGKKILVDPVMSGAASPLNFTTNAFKGTDVYTTDDIPEIDYLFISHDHWDHLDYETLLKLKPKIKKVITGLGTAAHLEHWGYDEKIIFEKDWDEEIILDDGFVVNTTSARHFSGRGFKRNQAMWMAYVLKTPTMKIYIGGDSGYDTHFKKIGEQHGPFDVAILECGQYHHNWKYIHMMPEELIVAAEDLKAKKIIPIHWAKFALGQHDWDEPIIRVVAEAKKKNVDLLHPMIGEEVDLKNTSQKFSEWWKGIN
jgi:L-ascorbate metabolism protein UlaG (beta-lactamase superfamily)